MKTASIILAVILFCVPVFAQNRNEFVIYTGGGFSALNYSVPMGETNYGFGALGGISYRLFFARAFGLGIGGEVAMYNSRYSLDRFAIAFPAIDIDGNSFEFRRALVDFEERQRALMLQVPVMFQLQFGSKHQYYLAFGAKGGMSLLARTFSNDVVIRNSGFYAEENFEYTQQADMGFGTKTTNGIERDLSFDQSAFASVETGIKFRLRDRRYLYLGVYFDYGLMNILSESSVPASATDVRNPSDFEGMSIFDLYAIEEVRPLAFGLKLGTSFGGGGFDKRERTPRERRVREPRERTPRERTRRNRRVKPVIEVEEPIEIVEIIEEEIIPEPKKEIVVVRAEKIANINNMIHFEEGSAVLSESAQRVLGEIVLTMRKYPDTRLEISGHSDIIGGVQVNIDLSAARARAAADYLTSMGISPRRLTVAAHGALRPIADNTTYEGQALNRRVEIRTRRGN